jgi:hypothetical protein
MLSVLTFFVLYRVWRENEKSEEARASNRERGEGGEREGGREGERDLNTDVMSSFS